MSLILIEAIDSVVDDYIDSDGRPSVNQALCEIPEHRFMYLSDWLSPERTETERDTHDEHKHRRKYFEILLVAHN